MGIKEHVVVGIDPGETNGYVVAKLSPHWEVLMVGQTDAQGLMWILRRRHPEVVVIEDFRLYAWKARSVAFSKNTAAEVIGAVDAWCQVNGAKLVRQPASIRKTVVKEVLVALNLWKGMVNLPHARDASRHLVAWVIRSQPKVVARAILGSKSSHTMSKLSGEMPR